eukprot:scaffold8_cov249-Pinguiococcus_pyrenoidosus.AAC.3
MPNRRSADTSTNSCSGAPSQSSDQTCQTCAAEKVHTKTKGNRQSNFKTTSPQHWKRARPTSGVPSALGCRFPKCACSRRKRQSMPRTPGGMSAALRVPLPAAAFCGGFMAE